jgi:hypothetical protein
MRPPTVEPNAAAAILRVYSMLAIGNWHRKKVGVLQVGVPMLPELQETENINDR